MDVATRIKAGQGGFVLFALTPPRQSTPANRLPDISRATVERLDHLNLDGLVLYDIDDESDRNPEERPFPFLPTIDPATFRAQHLTDWNTPVVVYRAVGKYGESDLRAWLEAQDADHALTVFVGASSRHKQPATSLVRAQELWAQTRPDLRLGGVAIPERHTRRGEEHLRRLTAAGILPHHVFDTLVRLAAGFTLAAIVGVAIGIAMGRSRRAEDIFLPLVSIGAPIPGIAYAPLFLLWFGLGNRTAVLLVAFVSAFPIIFNTWTGVKAVKEIWVRSAQVMGADQRRLFRHVILPGALPYILTGLRLGLAQAWRILVVVELLAAVPWGLGWLIFGAREFLNTDVMLAGVAVIGMVGLALETLVFERIEHYTVVRWGMMQS